MKKQQTRAAVQQNRATTVQQTCAVLQQTRAVLQQTRAAALLQTRAVFSVLQQACTALRQACAAVQQICAAVTVQQALIACCGVVSVITKILVLWCCSTAEDERQDRAEKQEDWHYLTTGTCCHSAASDARLMMRCRRLVLWCNPPHAN